MAAWLYKWLLISVVGAVPSLNSGYDLDQPMGTNLHPLHLSVTEVNHNSSDRTLEISLKLFTDDFERVLRQNYPGKKIDLINPPDRQAMNAFVLGYMKKNITMKVDGKLLEFTCLGFEQEDDATFSYFQVENIGSLSRLELTNTILHDLFTDQMNINHITVGGKRKSSRLEQPAKDAVFVF